MDGRPLEPPWDRPLPDPRPRSLTRHRTAGDHHRPRPPRADTPSSTRALKRGSWGYAARGRDAPPARPPAGRGRLRSADPAADAHEDVAGAFARLGRGVRPSPAAGFGQA